MGRTRASPRLWVTPHLETTVFEVLVASGPAPRGERTWPAKLASATIHAALVTLAVLGTGAARPAASPSVLETTITWTAPLPAGLALPAPEPGHPGPSITVSAVLAIPDVVPPVSTPWPGPAPVAPGIEPGLVIAALGRDSGGVARPSGVMDERLADEAPALLSHPAVVYPELLRQAGIEARLVVAAVLDTLGRVEPGTARVVGPAHELFVREALAVVHGSRYRAARVGERAVRVRILVPVAFALRR